MLFYLTLYYIILHYIDIFDAKLLLHNSCQTSRELERLCHMLTEKEEEKRSVEKLLDIEKGMWKCTKCLFLSPLYYST